MSPAHRFRQPDPNAMRRLSLNPARWLASPILILILTLFATPASGPRAEVEDAGYAPPPGTAFFLLTDSSFATTDEARVRLEVNSEQMRAVVEADGVDIALYRVEQPLAFLRQQRNLHRLDLKAGARAEGLANTLGYLWDQWWLRARRTWQSLFDGQARVAVTETAPVLKSGAGIDAPTRYVYPSPYRPIAGLAEVSRMRYPLPHAKPIAPPAELTLAGSSSNFLPVREGNVHIPLGRPGPGLFVVEAVVGRHRATALLFVSDTMALSKTASDQFFVWTAARATGGPVTADLVWSDLNGVLGSGRSQADGVLSLDHAVPETSYLFGVDAAGGVFITENFYYDSEIYNAKLYAYTDRPLYRPGDEVHVSLYGREFSSATRSVPLAAGSITVTVIDATGMPVVRQALGYDPEAGAGLSFRLPDAAPSGGYEIRMTRGEDEFSAAFRVSPYVKPHFEVLFEPARAAFKTGEALSGKLRLVYFDGTPVVNARLNLGARAQQLTMVDGDLVYGGAFPLQLDNDQALTTDAKGEAVFTLPPAREPSRVVLSVLASDGAAQRVRATRELLVERAASAWRLSPQRQFAAPAESVSWTMTAEPGSDGAVRPVRWVAIHQSSQTRSDGALAPAGEGFALALPRPGPYTIELRDAEDRLLGAAPFWVSGGELTPPRGSVDLVTDKPRYRAGERAKVLITFPEPVDDALLTLERDRVEAHGRLAAPRGLARLRRLNDRQWEAELDVQAGFAPNIALSVAYLKNGDFGFQNAGIVVDRAALQLTVTPDKASYQPGETATLDIVAADAEGRPAAAVVGLGVVDEMVYALQAELAPSLQDFFYHLRRNNVRTHSSQAFISYDEAVDARAMASIGRRQNERAVKLLERPRRDERDTAFFDGAIRTDASGRARVRFVVPDALTRWRITARARGIGPADGLLGERRGWFVSDKPFFATWTAPTWARAGDQPRASIAVFNQGTATRPLAIRLTQGEARLDQVVDARPGASFVTFDLPPLQRDTEVQIELRDGDRVVDRLATALKVQAPGWRGEQEQLLAIDAGATVTPLSLPADAGQIRVRALTPGQPAWSRMADALIDYPYGCVEQTASRLVPLALAIQSLSADLPVQAPLRQRLVGARLRLAALAGPQAVFGWWGHGTGDNLFLSAYAYYADWLATRALAMPLPAGHWERLLDIYREQAERASPTERAWALWLMQQMGLPTATMTEGLIADLGQRPGTPAGGAAAGQVEFLVNSRTAVGFAPLGLAVTHEADLALLLVEHLARQHRQRWPAALGSRLAEARARIEKAGGLLPQAVRVAVGAQTVDSAAFTSALARASAADPTVERGLALAVLSAGHGARRSEDGAAPPGPLGWVARTSASGQTEFWPPTPTGPPPDRLDWPEPAARPLQVAVRYTSRDDATAGGLGARIERRLSRLKAEGDRFVPEPLEPGAALSTRDLYLDEVTVSTDEALRFALLEMGLPPGALVEGSTWGIRLAGADPQGQPMARALTDLSDPTPGRYTVPIETLAAGKSITVRHLLRFGQNGHFAVPAARLWKMYQPGVAAREAGDPVQIWTLP